MKKEKIDEMVDRKIIELLSQNKSISEIKSDLSIRIANFTKTIERDANFEDIYHLTFDEISPVRMRYGVTYIKQCQKRIIDLETLKKFKENPKFKDFNFTKIFQMIQFRDKLNSKNTTI